MAISSPFHVTSTATPPISYFCIVNFIIVKQQILNIVYHIRFTTAVSFEF